ncbi:N-acetylmuramoyl-L-alanine amidase [Clostridium fallax]|uniref:N-acetylmuramoyl-L-alanine amidase n=1 Tax=Clostridium fallax TaxID=1533 RepID=A0A1M4Z7Z8_9CLOT|nr:N-acetylmuramoyl-L-alanine amidase [Clostridium fallax]SHF14199.1 N-acetylmuramoyl-L-alanine amidase [Clostridium fallax]SQB07494.1 CHAP domain-containing protein [Clostridium fallax]
MVKINESNLKWNGVLKFGNKPNKIIFHHAEAEKCSVYDIHKWHINRGWIGIGYHYLIRKDGSIWRGRPETAIGSHCLNYNSSSIGICFEGSFIRERMNKIQFDSGMDLLNDLRRRFGNVPLQIHKELNATNCPGDYFPIGDFRNGSFNDNNLDYSKEEDKYSPQEYLNNFTYPNNAQIVGDWFYVRDKEGSVISGRRVDDGDRITVLDISFSKQLVLVEYPTPNGIRRGYIKNIPRLIKYYYEDKYKNGSTIEIVYLYSDLNDRFGLLEPFEKATPLYRENSNLCIVYDTDKGKNSKNGFVKYDGEFLEF